jgi:hypothetical protein
MVIWILCQSGMWQPIELQGAPMKLGVQDGLVIIASADTLVPLALLYPWQDRFTATRYVLFPVEQEMLRVNGRQLFGHRLLRDRDEITLHSPTGSGTVFFTEESLPRVVNFNANPGGGTPTFCFRCKTKVEDEQLAVLCPRCKFWYHEMQERPCWSYDKECAGCHRTTTMDYAWKPEPVVNGQVAAARMARRRAATNEQGRG